MADVKLADLPATTTLAPTGIVPVDTGGVTSRIVPNDLLRSLLSANTAQADPAKARLRFASTKAAGRDGNLTLEGPDDDYVRIDYTYSGNVDGAGDNKWTYNGAGLWVHSQALTGSAGTVHALSLSQYVDAGAVAGEFTPFYIEQKVDAYGANINVWGTDQKIYGPRLGAPGLFVGQSLLVARRTSLGAVGSNVGMSIMSLGGSSTQNPDHPDWPWGVTYPLDYGLVVTGVSGDGYGASNTGFKTGIAVGVMAGPWGLGAQPRVETGIDVANWTTCGLNVGPPRSDVTNGPPAITVYSGIRFNIYQQTQPAASGAIRGMMWVTQGGAGVADAVQVCLKDAAGSYAWKTVTTA